jgi:hypothetical protein
MKITVDLNVLLDVAQNRLPHYHASEEVLHRARAGEYIAVLPGHAITTLHYIIEKWSGADLANQTIDGLLADFVIHPSDKTNFLRARQLPLGDFEDALVASVLEPLLPRTAVVSECLLIDSEEQAWLRAVEEGVQRLSYVGRVNLENLRCLAKSRGIARWKHLSRSRRLLDCGARLPGER